MIDELGTGLRRLEWDGCLNVRDLGGLPTTDGGRTRVGSLVRADNLDRLTAEGHAALVGYGIRTVIDLRDAEDHRPLLPPAAEIRLVRVPFDRLAGPEWWARYGELDGTPLSFLPYLTHCAPAVAAMAAAVAEAGPGGVVVHCGAGRDRTGLAALALLAAVGVTERAVVEDYRLSAANLRPLWAALGRPDQQEAVEALLQRHGVTAEQELGAAWHAVAAGAGVPAHLRGALRQRLVG
ncbi:Putative tyrosine phosphatase [Kitasatospora sp. MMS16-BH015]|uniref:tyrosine-protein phosphatase n=1 Tax=Kitasatospora sp. MMS16-BH015 TaxID=2018025 RepID=UPI000CA173EC|nr:tyrosine-protein phosphatase [Kitasatospora sp. MMS16-BH015]AUG78166.1 Putative tyrosine phosphatase [Kitasatospora sp. MMS16-BH015]